MLSCMYMAHAQGGGFNGFLKNSSSILSVNPDTLDLGYRPAGAWMRPYTFTLTNTSAEVQITSMQLQGSGVDALSIDLGDLTLPFTLGENESVTLGITWGDQPTSANGTLNVAYSNENGSGSANFAVMAQVYAPAIGDVWELAKEVNSLPFTETLSTLPNHEYLKYCAEVFAGGVGAGGNAVYWGIRFPAADLAAYAGQTLTKVGIFTDVDGDYGWTYSGNYTVNVYQGGADAPGTLVSTVTEYLLGDMAWHDVTLTTPVAIDATQDLWLTFYTSDIAYPMSGCDYVGNPNSDFLTLDGVNWDHSTDYGLDYTWMIRGVVEDPGLHNNYILPNPDIPDGNDVVYKLEFDTDVLLNANITGLEGKVYLYSQDFQGVGGPDETNHIQGLVPTNRGNRGSQAYGICIYSLGSWPEGFITFDVEHPESTTVIQSSYQDYFGLDCCNGYYYAVNNHVLIQMDFSGNIISSVSIGKNLTDGAWNPVNQTMYAISAYNLFTLDLNTGALDTLATNSDYFRTIACDANGQLYTILGDGNLYLVDGNTGELTLVGATGYTPYFAQSMAFDHLTGNLYWCFSNASYNHFMQVDPTTGAATLLLANTGETSGLCFPSNNLLNSASTFVASASVPYYLVASSTSDDFTVSMNTEPLPCPDTATLLTPSNDATNVSEVNTELRWKFGDYTTQYCLLFGTDPNDMDTLVPWTRELNVQHLFNESLNPCTTYYWQVGTRNDGCPDGVFSEVWSFTTVIRLYTITATSNPAEGGSITGADSYCYGSTCTLVATPNTGYHFVNWTVNDTEVSTSETLTFTVTQDTTLVANFDPIQLQVFADYYPNPADSLGEIVRVHWEEIIVDPHPFSEGFESGDFSKFNWQLDESYPWTITTNDPYEGSYCMKSGGSGVANMESIMTVTVDIPADGQMSFFCKISCESHWDYGYFYIDDTQMGQYTGYRSWEEKNFYITQGLHTLKWRYTKDNIGDYNDDCFYVDNITFYKSSEPIQPGWHTYCESGFNNAVGSNLTATPSWAYEYPISFLKSNYAGWYITKVSLFSDNMYNAVGGNYTCNIYVGGAEPASGTIVSTITVDVPSGQNDWVDWDLTTPVNVTGNEPIWIVWTANTTVGGWPAGCCGDLNNLGTWWNGGNGWEHLSYGTWTMRQYFDNGADKGFYSYGNESTRDLPNYRVYRALCNESDPTLLTDTVTVQEYLDNDWVSLDHGFYKYGVSIEEGPIYWSDSIKNIAVYYNINASVNPTEGGSVSGMGPQERHTTCSLVATNNTGYHFTNWTLNDSVVSTNNTLEVYVTQDSTFVAHFELNSYEIEASADPTEGGEITGTGTYYHFDDCTLIAAPLTGYHFVNWTVNDTEVSTSDTLTFTVTQDSTFVAHFELNSYDITVSSNPEEGGILTGGGAYDHGDIATISATPNEGYRFLRWTTPDSTLVTTETSFQVEVTQAADYVAHFTTKQYEIIAVCDPQAGTVTGRRHLQAQALHRRRQRRSRGGRLRHRWRRLRLWHHRHPHRQPQPGLPSR